MIRSVFASLPIPIYYTTPSSSASHTPLGPFACPPLLPPPIPTRVWKCYTSDQHTPSKTCLGVDDLTETTDGGADGAGRRGGEDVSAAGVLLSAALALPDTDSGALDGVLAARGAGVARVLGDLHLLDAGCEREFGKAR